MRTYKIKLKAYDRSLRRINFNLDDILLFENNPIYLDDKFKYINNTLYNVEPIGYIININLKPVVVEKYNIDGDLIRRPNFDEDYTYCDITLNRYIKNLDQYHIAMINRNIGFNDVLTTIDGYYIERAKYFVLTRKL